MGNSGGLGDEGELVLCLGYMQSRGRIWSIPLVLLLFWINCLSSRWICSLEAEESMVQGCLRGIEIQSNQGATNFELDALTRNLRSTSLIF